MIVAVPGSIGALEPDTLDTTTLLSQENPGMIYHRTMLQEGIKECFTGELHSDIRVIGKRNFWFKILPLDGDHVQPKTVLFFWPKVNVPVIDRQYHNFN